MTQAGGDRYYIAGPREGGGCDFAILKNLKIKVVQGTTFRVGVPFSHFIRSTGY